MVRLTDREVPRVSASARNAVGRAAAGRQAYGLGERARKRWLCATVRNRRTMIAMPTAGGRLNRG